MSATILSVSPDSTKSHVKFIEKNDLGITLLSDSEHKVLDLYSVLQIKKVYGREYYGVVTSTFLLNPDDKISYVLKKVRVKGHVEAVKEKLVELQS